MRIAPVITLSAEQRATLEQWARSCSLPARVVERARVVLLAAEGQQGKEIASAMNITPKKASRWRVRFLALGLAGLERDASRPGRTPKITARFIERVVHMTTRQKPRNTAHWSTRTMAAAVGISEASVRRIWHSHGLKPHRVESCKVSNDPEFAEKLEAIVGLYLHPPEHALVLCGDEEKSDPSPGSYATRLAPQARTQSNLDRRTQRGPMARSTASVRSGIAISNGWRHPRFHMHFTPTRASWLNMVERFFRDLTQNQLRRGVFRDVEELIMAIGSYIDRHNQSPKPFLWTARASDILEKVKRARRALNKRQSA